MLTQTIWQTLNMPIRGETNYSSMSFMIPLSPFGSRKVVIVMVLGVWGPFKAPLLQAFSTPHKAKLSFETLIASLSRKYTKFKNPSTLVVEFQTNFHL